MAGELGWAVGEIVLVLDYGPYVRALSIVMSDVMYMLSVASVNDQVGMLFIVFPFFEVGILY